MFCYQCEQTAKGTGCTAFGVCGKDPETSALQDLLVYATLGIGQYAYRARQLEVKNHDADVFVAEALFTTITNVDFDPERLKSLLHKAYNIKERVKQQYLDVCRQSGKTPEELSGPATWKPADSLDELVRQGEEVSLENNIKEYGEDIAGLMHLILYGLKGMAA